MDGSPSAELPAWTKTATKLCFPLARDDPSGFTPAARRVLLMFLQIEKFCAYVTEGLHLL